MIAKKLRFTTRLFDRFFRASERIGVGVFTFLVSRAQMGARFSVVVGKKVAKLAVDRNRLRRQMYEIIRKKVVPSVTDKNVICLYNGDKNGDNLRDFDKACAQLVSRVSSKNNSSYSSKKFVPPCRKK